MVVGDCAASILITVRNVRQLWCTLTTDHLLIDLWKWNCMKYAAFCMCMFLYITWMSGSYCADEPLDKMEKNTKMLKQVLIFFSFFFVGVTTMDLVSLYWFDIDFPLMAFLVRPSSFIWACDWHYVWVACDETDEDKLHNLKPLEIG